MKFWKYLLLIPITLMLFSSSVVFAGDDDILTLKEPAPISSGLIVNDKTKSSESSCKGGDYNVSMTDLLSPLNFIPIVPDICSGGSKNIQPMTLEAIPLVLVRGYGFLASVGVYLATFMVVVYGYQWMLGGLGSYGGVEAAKTSFKRGILALIIILVTTVLVFQMVELIGYDVKKIDSIINPK